MRSGSSFPYYHFASMAEAKKKLWAAVADGRVRVTRNGEFVPTSEAVAALESDDRTVAFFREDILREFPPLSPSGNA